MGRAATSWATLQTEPMLRKLLGTLTLFLMLISMLACTGDNSPSNGQKNYTISGTATYTDRHYDRFGFNNFSSYKPARYVRVEIYADGKVTGQSATNENGEFTVSFKSRGTPQLWVISETVSDAPVSLSVTDLQGNLYAGTRYFNAQTATEKGVSINVDLSNPASGAFNILDVLTNAHSYVQERTQSKMPALKAYWEIGNETGTGYCPPGIRDTSQCPQGAGIYVRGGTTTGRGDTDEYDDDVLLHEYGHYVEYITGILDSLGGEHYLNDTGQDLRLAWSEGFCNYFAGATKQWLIDSGRSDALSVDPQLSTGLYVDTWYGTFDSSILISYDFATWPQEPEQPTDIGIEPVYASNEVAVAKVLWSLFAIHDDPYIWEIIQTQFSSSSALSTLPNIWRGWHQLHAPDQETLAITEALFAERAILYSEDIYEPDNNTYNAKPLLLGEHREHTLYQGPLTPDRDLHTIKLFAGTSYVIETHRLSNGLDTYLRVYDNNGVLVPQLENDNHDNTQYQSAAREQTLVSINNGCALASRINSYTPQVTGFHYVEVTPSPDTPVSSDVIGGYTINVRPLPLAENENYRCSN